MGGDHMPGVDGASRVDAGVDHGSTNLVGKAAPRLDGWRVGDGAEVEAAPAVDGLARQGRREVRQPYVQLVAPAVDHLAPLEAALMAVVEGRESRLAYVARERRRVRVVVGPDHLRAVVVRLATKAAAERNDLVVVRLGRRLWERGGPEAPGHEDGDAEVHGCGWKTAEVREET